MTMDLMIDLETLGTNANAAIASIGAVLFDPRSDRIGDSLHLHVSLDDCLARGLTIDAGTVTWWLEQADDARHALVVGQLAAMPMDAAQHALKSIMPRDKEECLWCNGASFDFPILGNAYRACGLEPPWRYWAERDLRTLKALHKGASLDRIGTKHNALADAIHQARLVQHIFQFNPDIDA